VPPLQRRALVGCAGPLTTGSNTKSGYTTSTKCISTIALNDGSNIMLRFIVKIVVLMYFLPYSLLYIDTIDSFHTLAKSGIRHDPFILFHRERMICSADWLCAGRERHARVDVSGLICMTARTTVYPQSRRGLR
jgi:hypothetical protein